MRNPSPPEKVDELMKRLASEAASGGYHLNPDKGFTRELVEALLTNTLRYGYPSCPCRLASGARERDLDIICPCDYRDADLFEFAACYCALYVSEEIARGEKEAEPIPERRGKHGKAEKKRDQGPAPAEAAAGAGGKAVKNLSHPVWRCPVCGYLCAREHPPEKCPICRADKDRFKRFL